MPRPPKNGWSKDRKYFNGKPIKHWEDMAKKVVVQCLIRSSESLDTNSIVGEMAAKRLMSLALGENRLLVGEVLEERENWRHGVAMAFAEMLIDDESLKKIRAARRRATKA